MTPTLRLASVALAHLLSNRENLTPCPLFNSVSVLISLRSLNRCYLLAGLSAALVVERAMSVGRSLPVLLTANIRRNIELRCL